MLRSLIFRQTFAVSGPLPLDVSAHKLPSLPFAVSSICQLSVPPALPCRWNCAAPAQLPAASETAPVSPVSQLSLQGCQAPPPLRPTAPLRSRSIPKVSLKDKKNKLLTHLLRFLCGLIAASGSPSSASQSLIIGHLQTATAGSFFLLFPSRSSSTSFLLEVSERLWRTLLPSVSESLNCRAASLWNRKRLEVLRGNKSWLFHSRRGSVSFL